MYKTLHFIIRSLRGWSQDIKMHQISYLFGVFYNSNLVQKRNLKIEKNKFEDSIFLCVNFPRHTIFAFSFMKIQIMYPYKASFKSKISSPTYLAREKPFKKLNWFGNYIFYLYIAQFKKMVFKFKKRKNK